MDFSFGLSLTFAAFGLSAAQVAVTTTAPAVTVAAPPDSEEIYPQAMIVVVVVACAIFFGMGVAKLADIIHDRQSLRDDASDMSEYTRKLLQARVTVLAFKSAVQKEKKSKRNPEETAKKMLRLWNEKAAKRGKLRMQASVEAAEANNDTKNDVADPDVELKGFKQDKGVFMISPATIEAGPSRLVDSGFKNPDPAHLEVINEKAQQNPENAPKEVEKKVEITEHKPNDGKTPETGRKIVSELGEGNKDDMIPVSTDGEVRAKSPVFDKQKEGTTSLSGDIEFKPGVPSTPDDSALHSSRAESNATPKSVSQVTLDRMDSKLSNSSNPRPAATPESKRARLNSATSRATTPVSGGMSSAVSPTKQVPSKPKANPPSQRKQSVSNNIKKPQNNTQRKASIAVSRAASTLSKSTKL